MITKFKIFEIIKFPELEKYDKIYYKLNIDKSIEKFIIALEKINYKDEFFHYFNIEDLDINNDIVYLIFDTFDFSIDYEEPYNKYNYSFGGEIYVNDYEVSAKRYNI